YEDKEKSLGLNPETEQPLLRDVERFVILQVVDLRWREHLENMDYLREGVHLRSMAQKDPLVEYTAEGHVMFDELNLSIREEVVSTLFHAQLAPEEVEALQPAEVGDGAFAYEHQLLAGAEAIAAAGASDGIGTLTGIATAGGLAAPAMTVSTAPRRVSENEKLGRNDP